MADSGLGGLGGAIGGLIGLATSGNGGKDKLQAALKLWQELQTSNFDMRSLPAPILKVLGEVVPQIYQAQTPEDFQQIGDSLEGRNAQVQALGQLGQYAQRGTPEADRIEQEQNANSALGAASGARQAALRSLAAKGNLNGGDEIQAMLAGNQTGANLGRDLSQESAKQAALRRMQAVQSLGTQGAALRAGDVDVAQKKADIANRFKEVSSALLNQAAQYNAGARERASTANFENKQRIGDTNAMNQYGVNLENLNRQNRLKGDIFGQNLAKTQGEAGAYGSLADWEDAQRAARIGAASSLGSGIGGAAGSLIPGGGGGGGGLLGSIGL